MRLPISSVIASLFVALTTPNSPSFAEQHSTIRLASASEPVSDSTPEDANLPPSPPVVEQRPVAPPIQSVEQPTEQSDRPAPPPIIRTSFEAPAAPLAPAAQRTRMPAGLYASPEARSTLNQMPGPMPVQASSRLQTTRRGGKPFQDFSAQPTVSPYYYMNAGTNSATPIANYLAFVRPQLEQAESGRQQQRDIQQLRSQLQKVSSNGAAPRSANPNSAARYMDTGQFYRGLQR